ncbi:O-linked N-acetylglucosamine transferase family protein [Microvirga rosea]|uniref:O-linked N-acetylglucosamine transferase family protein n=1 Tax=Microvirga rosea TaxID=2715425 RepID=UPI001D0A21A5|nr:tetratricopeptide repeat protein [Microvirga rosea]MCB8823459.1 tetratricopeptide repeat protein [Microvirga rosea]
MNRHQRRQLASRAKVRNDLVSLAEHCLRAGKLEDAELTFRQALKEDPDNASAWHSLGLVCNRLGRPADAVGPLQKAINLSPETPAAHTNLGIILLALGDHQAALTACTKAIQLDPNFSLGHRNLGTVLAEQGRKDEALAAYHRAIAVDPNPPDASFLSSIAGLLQELKKFDEAIIARKMIVMIEPTSAEAFYHLGEALYNAKSYPEAFDAFKKALDLDGTYTKAAVEICIRRRYLCDWDGLENDDARLLQLIRNESVNRPPHPFPMLMLPTSEEERLQIARNWSKQFNVPANQLFCSPTRQRPRANAGRIRVGYLSADYSNHATTYLVAELLELHDRDRFEIFGYSIGPDDGSDIRKRVVRAFDTFVDLQDLSDYDAAKKIYDDQVDILVDLKGHTRWARTHILGMRPAPIQVNFVGYPGTMGSDFIDYVIGDPIVTPASCQPYYSEKLVQLPHAYQPNDTKRAISPHTPTRSDCGLPEEAFVFCCFNDSYKLSRTFFSTWMRLLASVPGSVLWLLDVNEAPRENLRREAIAHGIDPRRLVFAPKVSVPDHLARHHLADLFLDTLPYNAHTTASDALWAGLPVLTCMGGEFPGRVAASLLTAMGLSELITQSLEDYELLARSLAGDKPRLDRIKKQLIETRLSMPLFDTKTYTTDLEEAYVHMVKEKL